MTCTRCARDAETLYDVYVWKSQREITPDYKRLCLRCVEDVAGETLPHFHVEGERC